MTTKGKLSAKEQVLSAFHLLLVEKGYINLTVQDILTRAGVGRTTFYSHFTGKEDVLRSSIGRLRDGLLHMVDVQGLRNTPLSFSLAFFQHIISHTEIYDQLVGREEIYMFERYFRRMLAELVLSEICSQTHSSVQRLKVECIAQHIAGSIWAISTWWLERKQLSAEEMNECFRKMVLPGLEHSLKAL